MPSAKSTHVYRGLMWSLRPMSCGSPEFSGLSSDLLSFNCGECGIPAPLRRLLQHAMEQGPAERCSVRSSVSLVIVVLRQVSNKMQQAVLASVVSVVSFFSASSASLSLTWRGCCSFGNSLSQLSSKSPKSPQELQNCLCYRHKSNKWSSL